MEADVKVAIRRHFFSHLNKIIHQGSCIYYVITFGGPERPTPPCNIVIIWAYPPLCNTVIILPYASYVKL